MNHIDIDMHRALSELDDPRCGIAIKRNTAIDLVTALIDFLDDTEGDPDLEDIDPDLEPSLGGGEVNCQVDLELDDCDSEDDSDSEPSLGAPEIPPIYLQRGGLYGWYSALGSQDHWASGLGHMEEETVEAEDAGGGDIQDVPHDDDTDQEPSLGSTEEMDQEARQAVNRSIWLVDDAEEDIQDRPHDWDELEDNLGSSAIQGRDGTVYSDREGSGMSLDNLTDDHGCGTANDVWAY
jgi:hypothetical protein